jgi:hypothetical protein
MTEHRIAVLPPRRLFREVGEHPGVIVRQGVLALMAMSHSRRAIVGLRFPGEIVLPGVSRFALEPLVKTTVERENFTTGDETNQQRYDLAIAQEWLRIKAYGADERIAHLLCEAAVRQKAPREAMNMPFTQLHIAEITGQTSVNVNRVMNALVRDGLIEYNRDRVVFHDFDELARRGDFKPDYLKGD